MARKSGTTSDKAAKAASKTMKSDDTGRKSKSAGASALAQAKTPKKETSQNAAKSASKTLKDGRTAKDSKSAAGSALAQKPSSKSSKKK